MNSDNSNKQKIIPYKRFLGFIRKGLKDLVNEIKKPELSVNEMKVKSPYIYIYMIYIDYIFTFF